MRSDLLVGDYVSLVHTPSQQVYTGVLMDIQTTAGVDWIKITPGIAFPLTDVMMERG